MKSSFSKDETTSVMKNVIGIMMKMFEENGSFFRMFATFTAIIKTRAQNPKFCEFKIPKNIPVKKAKV